MLNKDITSAGGGGAGSDQWGPAGGMGGCNKQDYYWFPFRQEYKLDNLEHDSKNQTLFQQLYDKVEYTDNPGNAYATIVSVFLKFNRIFNTKNTAEAL